jgi:hypothetical protein
MDEELLSLAEQCDAHAKALGENVRALYEKVLDARAANSGRGPSGLVLYNALQRAAARHFNDTPILRMHRGTHPSCKGFKEQVSVWLEALNAPSKKAA